VNHLFKEVTTDDERPTPNINDDLFFNQSMNTLSKQMTDKNTVSDLQITDLLKHEKVNNNILVLTTWNTGDTVWESLDDLRTHDLPRLIRYAEDNNLTDSDGWSWVKRSKRALARQSRTLRRLLSPPASWYKCRRVHSQPRRIKYNIEVPRNPKDAVTLDNINKNKLW